MEVAVPMGVAIRIGPVPAPAGTVKATADAETLDGVKTEKLELIPKDPAVKKNLPKVTVWMDTERAVSLKQVFDEGPGQYRVCVYYNIKTNQPLPPDAFTFKTDRQTEYINQ